MCALKNVKCLLCFWFAKLIWHSKFRTNQSSCYFCWEQAWLFSFLSSFWGFHPLSHCYRCLFCKSVVHSQFFVCCFVDFLSGISHLQLAFPYHHKMRNTQDDHPCKTSQFPNLVQSQFPQVQLLVLHISLMDLSCTSLSWLCIFLANICSICNIKHRLFSNEPLQFERVTKQKNRKQTWSSSSRKWQSAAKQHPQWEVQFASRESFFLRHSSLQQRHSILLLYFCLYNAYSTQKLTVTFVVSLCGFLAIGKISFHFCQLILVTCVCGSQCLAVLVLPSCSPTVHVAIISLIISGALHGWIRWGHEKLW